MQVSQNQPAEGRQPICDCDCGLIVLHTSPPIAKMNRESLGCHRVREYMDDLTDSKKWYIYQESTWVQLETAPGASCQITLCVFLLARIDQSRTIPPQEARVDHLRVTSDWCPQGPNPPLKMKKG